MAAVLNNAGNIEKITFFMEECKRMGLECFGPDINESQKGFSVNKKGHIRFGLGGLKGVGEAAVESLIEERAKNGVYQSVFDMIKRVNQRTVNKKTLESLIYAGAFDCFTDLHRAQYFFTPQNDTSTGLEKIVRFGNVYQAQNVNTSNTLFGGLTEVMEIPPPKIPPCEVWPLTELLNYEKEVTGMFMSGHPLDNFRFEIKHYGITTIAEFNEIKDTLALQANPGRSFRLAGLVTDAQHRVTRTGRQFGSFWIEDYSGKSEFMLWSDDYMRFTNYLEKGKNLFITGAFKPRFNKTEFEFKIERISLLEGIKQNLTKQVIIDVEARHISEELIRFFEKNLKTFPGTSMLKFNIKDFKAMCKVSLQTLEAGFQMNDEMAAFLQGHPEMDVQVVTA
jgi:DNA polymerase-3 subunit alpha